ncbi:cytochrome b/b6 domain-containing protein [Psychrobacter sp. FDAARGOS_221]|uniref:cytochrome b/b6 domain-containing protein n=1 Tax=Psychrobacter sp. FDAARGOS_221 TaxID=1975705 RepID=UPI000BB5461A|nr:cytochrome b/b6 domain-containing protein [Psychrobacter sp. FDAARGOS_221]PNK59620.1 cytochrome B [Psychrobacter sp. FDAARGOS_221]
MNHYSESNNPHTSYSAPIQDKHTIKVWDICVRFTHWVIAAGILANLAFTDDGSELHEYVGYVVVGLVVLRLIWGFIGTRYARFSNFFPTPARLKSHLKALSHHQIPQNNVNNVGHNPLAALMMFALWAVIIGLGITGYAMEAHIIADEDTLEDIHEVFASSLYLLVPLHVLSAILMSRLQKQNLIKSMITGNKQVVVSDLNTK